MPLLTFFQGYNFTADDLSTEEKSLLTYQRIAEAFKFAYSVRTREGDPDFFEANYFKEVNKTYILFPLIVPFYILDPHCIKRCLSCFHDSKCSEFHFC